MRLVAQRLHRALERGALEYIETAIQLVPESLLLLRQIGERLPGIAAPERVRALVEAAQLVAHLRRQRVTEQLLRLMQP